jgi:hypothetical protein
MKRQMMAEQIENEKRMKIDKDRVQIPTQSIMYAA